MKKKWLSAAAAAVLSVCALAAPISVPNTVTPVAVQAASSGTTLADMPSTYQSAAEWILQNRIISEGSVKTGQRSTTRSSPETEHSSML